MHCVRFIRQSRDKTSLGGQGQVREHADVLRHVRPANFDVIVMVIIGINVKCTFDIYVNIYCHRGLCASYVINLKSFVDICAINYVMIADARLPLRAAQAQAHTILATCSERFTTECPGHVRSARMCSLLLRTPTSPAQQRTAWWRACRCGQKAPLCMACDFAIHTCMQVRGDSLHVLDGGLTARLVLLAGNWLYSEGGWDEVCR